MASGPAKPPAEEPPGASAAAETGAPAVASGSPPPPGEERYGPLRVLRSRKDDGRALTLYSVATGEAGRDAG